MLGKWTNWLPGPSSAPRGFTSLSEPTPVQLRMLWECGAGVAVFLLLPALVVCCLQLVRRRQAAAARDAALARQSLDFERAAREAAEAQLRQSEERLQILLQSRLSEALDLLDPDGKVLTWNASAMQMKRYDLADAIGKNFSIFFTPEDVAAGLPARLLAIARDNGTCVSEHWCLRKDGTRFLARRSLQAIRGNDGSLRGFANVTRDMTHERIEEQQRAIIIDAAPNGMMIVDETGVITLANAQCAQIFDYPTGALTGQPIEILVPSPLQAEHAVLRSRFTGGEDTRSLAAGRVVTGRKRDGGSVQVEILLMPVKTPRGRIVVASVFDATERQRRDAERMEVELRERCAVEEANARLDLLSRDLARARDRAEHANQAKSRFLASVTHELRTPLHGILGYAELMSLEGDLTRTQLARLDVMMAAGQHLLAMVNSVLDMSQIEADQLELHPGPAELRALVSVCLDVVRPAADVKGLALIQAPTTPLNIIVDVTRLQQVLINLLGNAVKFTPSGTVRVRQAEIAPGKSFRLEVVDTGPGVRAMHREKLFNTFERLNAEAVSGIEGTGLGLAVAARLVDVMGGRIGYDDNPGGGSVFWLELPIGGAAAEPAAQTSAPAPARAAKALRVLVADDEPLNRNIAREFLRSAGHDVVCVSDGASAVEAAAAGDFDVILMDVRMPGMNGLEATRRIRGLPAPRGQVCVVAVTAQAFAQQIETCLQAGMDSHISKPFTRPALIAALDKLGSVQRRRAAEAAQPDAGSDARSRMPVVFDRAAIDEVLKHLPVANVAGYLQTIAATGAALQARLRANNAPGLYATLGADVHRLAGTAGMLGFAAVVGAASVFEAALDNGAADIACLAEDLAEALEVTMPIIQQEQSRVNALATK